MLKNLLFIIISFFLVICAVLVLTGKTIIIPISEYKAISDNKLNIGGKVIPLERFDFNNDNWTAYIVFSSTDSKELPGNFANANCFKTKNIEILKKMQQDWEFVYVGADVATVESELLIFNDGELVYKTGIVVSDAIEGLQSKTTGWLDGTEGKKLSKYFQKFKKVYLPIIIL